MTKRTFPTRRILEDVALLGFADPQNETERSNSGRMAKGEKGAAELERLARAKVGKPPDSDARLKRDIHHVATLEDGFRVYSFRYLWDDAVHVGVMAQDLLENETWRPAVSDAEGYYTVDYGLLGLRMTTLDDWNANGVQALRA